MAIELVGYSDEGYAVFLEELTTVAATLPKEFVLRELYEQIPLEAGSADYADAAQYFTDAKLLNSNQKLDTKLELVKIFKIKAPHLQAKYNAHKIQLKNQYFFDDNLLGSLEREVFHGTQQMFTTKILAGGFNPKFGSQDNDRCWHGQGCYFARELAYSSDERYSKANVEGHKFVFVVRLLVGATFEVSIKCYNSLTTMMFYFTL